MKVSSFKKSYAMFTKWFQMRFVWHVMIHGIFMFMHLMLFTKRITYVFKKNLEANQRSLRRKLQGRS